MRGKERKLQALEAKVWNDEGRLVDGCVCWREGGERGCCVVLESERLKKLSKRWCKESIFLVLGGVFSVSEHVITTPTSERDVLLCDDDMPDWHLHATWFFQNEVYFSIKFFKYNIFSFSFKKLNLIKYIWLKLFRAIGFMKKKIKFHETKPKKMLLFYLFINMDIWVSLYVSRLIYIW